MTYIYFPWRFYKTTQFEGPENLLSQSASCFEQWDFIWTHYFLPNYFGYFTGEIYASVVFSVVFSLVCSTYFHASIIFEQYSKSESDDSCRLFAFVASTVILIGSDHTHTVLMKQFSFGVKLLINIFFKTLTVAYLMMNI